MTQPVVSIRTPENVELEYHLAGVGSRGLAQLLDLIFLGITYILLAIAVVYWVLQHLFNAATSYVVGVAIFLYFFLFWGYFILFEYYMSGQTLGKRIVKLRVVRQDGRNATFVPILLRNLFRLIDILPSGYLVGFIVMMFDAKERRIGDLVAGTMVVKASVTQQYMWLNSLEQRPQTNTASRTNELTASEATVAAGREIVTVKAVGVNLAVQTPMPPSWQTFVLNVSKRIRNMSRSQREVLAERTWSRMEEEGLIQLVNDDGSETSHRPLVSNAEKLKLLVALARNVRQQQRRKRR